MSKCSNKRLSVIPLGGVTEIGKNILCLEADDDIIIIDAGLKFPDESMPGVDLVIPNITYLKKNRDKIKGIILTHGHEDHIGALPFILPELNVPVYGTLLTMGLVERKLLDRTRSKSRDIKKKFSLNVITPEDKIELGCFKVNFFRVNHSIPDGVGLAIETPAGLVVHTGDFKIDQTPVDGKVMELSKLAQYGEREVLLLICDTTNAQREGYTLSEKAVGVTLMDVFARLKGRIIVTTFASNVHRLQQVINAAAEYGRKVALSGRSMVGVAEVASKLGYLHIPENMLIEIDEAKSIPDHKVVIVTTGSQGEPTAALTRMAQQSHRQVQIKSGDAVIVSANPIPGNERLVARTIDSLFRIGAEVIYSVDGTVHVSGHASKEEIKTVINLVKPKYVLPFHGEYKHMAPFAKLAVEMGIEKEHVINAQRGERWDFHDQKATLAGTVPVGEVLVDGLGVGDVGNIVLHDRQVLSTEGVVVVVLAVNRNGDILAGPDIVSRGFVYIQENKDFMNKAKYLITEELKKRDASKFKNWSFLKEIVIEVLAPFIYQHIGRKPVILPIIIDC